MSGKGKEKARENPVEPEVQAFTNEEHVRISEEIGKWNFWNCQENEDPYHHLERIKLVISHAQLVSEIIGEYWDDVVKEREVLRAQILGSNLGGPAESGPSLGPITPAVGKKGSSGVVTISTSDPGTSRVARGLDFEAGIEEDPEEDSEEDAEAGIREVPEENVEFVLEEDPEEEPMEEPMEEGEATAEEPLSDNDEVFMWEEIPDTPELVELSDNSDPDEGEDSEEDIEYIAAAQEELENLLAPMPDQDALEGFDAESEPEDSDDTMEEVDSEEENSSEDDSGGDDSGNDPDFDLAGYHKRGDVLML